MPFFELKFSAWHWPVVAACALFWVQAATAHNVDIPSSQRNEERRGTVTFFNKPGEIKYSNFDDQNGVILFEANLEGRDVLALLDTGSDYSLVSTSLIEELGISPQDVAESIRTTNSAQLSRRVPNLRFEHIDQYSMTRDFYTFDLSGMSQALGRRVDVVIGYDLLSQLSFVLDGKSKRILVLPSGLITPTDDRFAVIRLNGGVFEGSLNGRNTRFAVDLGSNSEISVYEPAWERLFGNQHMVSRGRITDASGVTRAGEGIEGVQLSAFGASATVFVTKKPRENGNFDALVGYPLFHGRVTIFDYPRNVIYFEREP